VVLGMSALAICGAYGYFRNVSMERPPIGVFNLYDVFFVMVFVIAAPYLYLALPRAAAACVLGLAALGILLAVLEPVLRNRAWLVAAIVLAADVTTSVTGRSAVLVNDVVLVLLVIGLANMWAQFGMKARDAAIMGLCLAVYDLVATSIYSVTGSLIDRLAGLPFSPSLLWRDGQAALGIGLGDLFMCAVFPLVLRKAYGRAAGRTAAVISIAILAVLMAFPVVAVFPVMVVLGPLIALQYFLWSRRGRERTMAEYRSAES
jgi:hypothetical protein